jgi:hypothetical protein
MATMNAPLLIIIESWTHILRPAQNCHHETIYGDDDGEPDSELVFFYYTQMESVGVPVLISCKNWLLK